MSKQKILITGAFGYLGGRLAQYLVQNLSSHEVILGTAKSVDQYPKLPFEAKLRQGDLNDVQSLGTQCEGVDTVIHLAAVNEIISGQNPALALEVNTAGTLRLLQACVTNQVKRFIYFSTAHVYGAPLAGHIDETRATRSTHPYAYTHRASEDILWSFVQQGKIEGIVLRLSNAIGAPLIPTVDRWSLLVNDLCRQAITQKTLTLRSAGKQQRDFIALLDVLRATEHMVKLPKAAIGDGLFNLGGRYSMSVEAMVELIVQRCELRLGFKPAVIRPAHAGNEVELALKYDVTKLEQTGFSWQGHLADEVDQTLAFCKEHFHA